MNWFNHRKEMCGLKVKITELKREKAGDKVLIKDLANKLAAAEETIKHLRGKAEFSMPSSMQGKFYNACTDSCDMIDGPCACGAWHSAKEWIEKLNKRIESLGGSL